MSYDQFSIQFPADSGDGEAAAVATLVHTTGSDVSPPLQDPPLLCWETSGLRDSSAALACALGRLHAKQSETVLPSALKGEASEEWGRLHEAVLIRSLERDELLLAVTQKKLDAVLEASREFAAAFRQAKNPGAMTQLLQEPLPSLLERAGMRWSAGGSLAGFVAFLQFAATHWQAQRQQLHARCQAWRAELETWTLQRDASAVLAHGAGHLLGQLKRDEDRAAGSDRTERLLREHIRRPLSQPWTWLLDEWGDVDGV